jgi:hypothetical protein
MQHRPDPLQIEVLAEDKTSRYDRTVVATLFVNYWRVAVLGNSIVGYSPFPDGSLILSIYSAGKVLNQMYNYLTEDKVRHGLLPGGQLIPKGGLAMQDYWYISQADHCKSLAWYAAYSSAIYDPVLTELCSSWTWTPTEFLDRLKLFDVNAVDEGGNTFPLWPSVYWQHLRSNKITLTRMDMTADGISGRATLDERTALVQFNDTWLRTTVRGVRSEGVGWTLGDTRR